MNFIKAKTKLGLSLNYNANNSYLFVNRKELCKFKINNNNVNFPIKFCLGSISNEFGPNYIIRLLLEENLYYLSVDDNAIDKSEILGIQKCLMVKNNI